jgi:thiol-disulfide isomerase/thioredoxin
MRPLAAAAMLLIAAACSGPSGTPAIPQAEIEAAAGSVVSYPLSLDPACRDGRATAYDQCSNQLDLFAAAVERAQTEDKAVLVIIGAEWCGWCRAFDAHLKGATGRYDYVTRERRGDVSQAALELVRYTAANFVVVHIEDDYAPGADEVVSAAGAQAHFQEKYPTIFAAGPDGKFAAKLDHPYVKIQISGPGAYQGYDRGLVLKELKRLHKAAVPR